MRLTTPTPLTLLAGDVRNVEAKLQHAIAQMHAEYDAASRSYGERRALTHGMAIVLRELNMLSDPDFRAIVAACYVNQGYQGPPALPAAEGGAS